MSIKIAILNDFSSASTNAMGAFKQLEDKYDVTVTYHSVYRERDNDEFLCSFRLMESSGPDAFPENEELNEAIRTADVVISLFTPIPSNAVREAKNLKAVCLLRSGVENVNVPNATACGVKIVNVPGRLAVPVSEFTIGLMLSEMKNIARAHSRVRSGSFSRDFVNNDYCYNMKGKKIGIVGLGAVGKRVAKVVAAMEGSVLVYDPYVPGDVIDALGYQPMELNDLCREADVISMHFRLTPETQNLIGEEQIALMKPSCYVINTARAGLIDEAALVRALQERRIGGAGLDVFNEEPLPQGHPLLSLENVTLTPHLAGGCSDIMDITNGIMMGALENYLENGEWINTVNK